MISNRYIQSIAQKLGVTKKIKVVYTQSDQYVVKENNEEIIIYTHPHNYLAVIEALALSKISEQDPLITDPTFHPLTPESLKTKFTFIIHPIQQLWMVKFLKKNGLEDIYDKLFKLAELALNLIVDSENLAEFISDEYRFAIFVESLLIVYNYYKNQKTDAMPDYLNKLLDKQEAQRALVYLKYVDSDPSFRILTELASSFNISVKRQVNDKGVEFIDISSKPETTPEK